ncbi:sugar transferase, partial [Bacteroidota bacterium]
GKNRAISLAEGLGRFYYCGYEILGLKTVGRFVYFIAKKVKKPLEDLNPSYGPLIKLKRIGKDGKEINVYKLRTMYPYSEYLQEFVYDMNELKAGGKLQDDFRITSWGRIFRKLWLDEFPMLINWFKRELKLVGIRPLSKHYYNLYKPALRERRLKYKPGLVPPFYADLPKILEEIMASEEKYLDQYDQHPFLTDIKYFFKAWYNILVKHARSG